MSEETKVQPVPPQTVEAPRVPHVGSVVSSTKPAAPANLTSPPSLVSQVTAANARVSPLVKKLQERTKSTYDLTSPWARILLHGEIDSLKTFTAHKFGTPEQTRTILTRGEDQMIPVINDGYKYLKVDNGEEFAEALSYAEHIWPDWIKHPEPVLIIDDLTRAKDFVVKSSKTYESGGQSKEYKDTRKIYGVALDEFDAMFTRANAKKIHIILIATSKAVESKITLEETIQPDLSPSIGNLIMSDYSFIFFLNRKKPPMSRMLTVMDSEVVQEYDEAQKKSITYSRYYFARHKLPAELVGKGIIQKYEPCDLRSVWDKVKNAKRKV